jgi:hypothetical protein
VNYRVYQWPKSDPIYEGDKPSCKTFIKSLPTSQLPVTWVENEQGDTVYEPHDDIIGRSNEH